jgi:hypothetical protein
MLNAVRTRVGHRVETRCDRVFFVHEHDGWRCANGIAPRAPNMLNLVQFPVVAEAPIQSIANYHWVL